MFVVGLTGGIGSGKTTVSDMFAELGIEIVDADVLSREAVAPGSAGLAKLVETFSEDILLTKTKDRSIPESRPLDRKKLRSLIFNDPDAKLKVEAIIHPIVRSSIHQALESNSSHPYVILSSPLLFETNQNTLTDINVVVDVSTEQQLIRTLKRDSTNEQEIKKIIESQLSRKERLEKSDYQIDNSQSKEFTRLLVGKLHNSFLQLAKDKLART